MNFSKVSSISFEEKFCKRNLTDESPFINYDFFLSLEKSLCTNKKNGWEPEHIVIKQSNKTIGFIPNFKKSNSNGEYIFDYAWENAHYQLGKNYFPKYLSAIPFTPVTRNNFIYGDKNIIKLSLINKLKNFIGSSKVSSFHINFIDKKASEELKGDFMQRLGIQYHWQNKSYNTFDDFLDSMKSRKKKNIIKERKFLKESNIFFTFKYGEEISEKDLKLFFECYKNTIKKKWSYQYLNFEFFRRLLDSDLKKRILLIIASNDKNFIGSSLHFIGKNTLYGRYWGTLQEIPYLHFELCYYQAIEFAIKKKISKIEAGAQGEHKISRGYLPRITYSNHWVKDEMIRDGIKKFLSYGTVILI